MKRKRESENQSDIESDTETDEEGPVTKKYKFVNPISLILNEKGLVIFGQILVVSVIVHHSSTLSFLLSTEKLR